MSDIKGAVNTTFVSNQVFYSLNATFGIKNATFVVILRSCTLRIP